MSAAVVEIAPSILAADFARLGVQVNQAESGGATFLHIDVMDGHFVPNISIGIPVVESLRKHTPMVLDCHLMVSDPDAFIDPFCKAGAQMITVHQEACTHLARTLGLIADLGAAPGVALNPATPVFLLEEVLAQVRQVLVMTVNPGFGGQKFIASAMGKIERLDRIRAERGLDFLIQADGGVTTANARALAEAGCDILVAGSSVFGTDDVTGNVIALSDCANRSAPVRA